MLWFLRAQNLTDFDWLLVRDLKITAHNIVTWSHCSDFFLLRSCCRDHSRVSCQVQCVGVDGMVGVATRVRHSTKVPSLDFPATRIQVQFDCRQQLLPSMS